MRLTIHSYILMSPNEVEAIFFHCQLMLQVACHSRIEFFISSMLLLRTMLDTVQTYLRQRFRALIVSPRRLILIQHNKIDNHQNDWQQCEQCILEPVKCFLLFHLPQKHPKCVLKVCHCCCWLWGGGRCSITAVLCFVPVSSTPKYDCSDRNVSCTFCWSFIYIFIYGYSMLHPITTIITDKIEWQDSASHNLFYTYLTRTATGKWCELGKILMFDPRF